MCFSKRVRASDALILSLSSFRDIVQAVFALSASSSYLRLSGQDILASTEDCIPTKQLLYLPAAAFASSCLSFAIVAAVESFRLPDLWRRFRLVAACSFAMYP